MPPELSIVIPTHKRANLLKFLLDSILEQGVSFSRFEIIVVDNYPAPYQPTQELCQRSDYSNLTMKCVNDPILGLSEARNFGMRLATAPWVAFIDDDEKLPNHWVDRTLEIIETKAPAIFGGPYHPYYIGDKPNWFKNDYLVQTLGSASQWLADNRCLFGGNIVFNKEWLERLNGFSTEMGMVGFNKEYGEETEIQVRAYQMGAMIYYDPDLYIFHYVHPDRMKAIWFVTSGWYHGKAKAKIISVDSQQGISPFRYKLWLIKKLLFDVLLIAGRYINMPFRNHVIYPTHHNYIIERIAPAVSFLGMSWTLFRLSFKRSV